MKKTLILWLVLLAPISFASPPQLQSKYSFSRPNIHGGYTYYSQKGSVRSIPNNQGGYNYYGKFRGYSRQNVFGGQTFYKSKVKVK